MPPIEQDLQTISTNCIAVRLRKLNRIVSGIYDDALSPLGLKVSQLNVLVAAGCLKQARPAQLGKALALDESTVSRNVERMRARGWLEVVPDAEDGRGQRIQLTAQGRELIHAAVPAWKQAQTAVASLLGREGRSGLERAAHQASER